MGVTRLATVLAALTFFAAMSGTPARGLAAPASFEPNDSLPSAFGPLVPGQTYTAGIETGADRDFYFFYVTSPDPGQVSLTVANLGGGSGLSGINATILDSTATPVATLPYLGDHEGRTAAVSLQPQKYFVEVAPSEGFGDAYSLALGGSGGAVGAYSQIARRCTVAVDRIKVATASLTRAEARLQRATARLQRARYAGQAARRGAHAAYRSARLRISAGTRELRKARASREPWCSIPQ